MSRKIFYSIVLITFILLLINPQPDTLSQESEPTQTVIVCPDQNPDLPVPCTLEEGVTVVSTLTEAYDILAPEGGTIMVNAGDYEANIRLDGDWIIKGYDFPSTVTITPEYRGNRYRSFEFPPEGTPAIFTVASNASVHLENLTIFDNVDPADPPMLIHPRFLIEGPAVTGGLIIESPGAILSPSGCAESWHVGDAKEYQYSQFYRLGFCRWRWGATKRFGQQH